MVIHINLLEEMGAFIKGKVADGFYGNATGDSRAEGWQSAISQGDAQLDRGEEIVCTPQEIKNITESAINAMHNGFSIDPDVLPLIASSGLQNSC